MDGDGWTLKMGVSSGPPEFRAGDVLTATDSLAPVQRVLLSVLARASGTRVSTQMENTQSPHQETVIRGHTKRATGSVETGGISTS